ncbi:MAG: DHHA1 domain-containing protein, partial [Chloroflexota bacterium]
GTHARASGQIGGFLITGERSIGSGMRRIEAVTGVAADALVRDRFDALERTAAALGAQSVDAVEDRIAALQGDISTLRKQLRSRGAEPVVNARERVGDIDLVLYAVPFESQDRMKSHALTLRKDSPDAVIAVGMDADEPQLFVSVPPALVERGVSAGDLVRGAMPHIDGKGGGRPEMAQGKGSRRAGLVDALAAIRTGLEATQA